MSWSCGREWLGGVCVRWWVLRCSPSETGAELEVVVAGRWRQCVSVVGLCVDVWALSAYLLRRRWCGAPICWRSRSA